MIYDLARINDPEKPGGAHQLREPAHRGNDKEQLESDLKKPVITSNQATLWNILRLADIQDRIKGFGQLLCE